MTFLEYVCERLMGPAAKPGGSAGESYWVCPFHNDNDPSFHTLPHKPEYKDRWRCFGCGKGGDEADLVKEFYPAEGWPHRRARLDRWRREYERGAMAARQPQTARAGTHPSPGTGEARGKPDRVYDTTDPREDEFSEEADAAVDVLIDLVGGDSGKPYCEPLDAAAWEKLLLFKAALEVCARHRLHPLGLAGRLDFEEWARRTDAEHMAGCRDPECDWFCCRIARGWTVEEIAAANEAYRQKARAKKGQK
jgi:hypothetical protein